MLLDLTKCAGCYGCVVSCKMEHGTRPGINYNALQTLEWGEYPKANQRFLLTLCNHCDNPECVSVCPTGASTKSATGTVLIDYATCIGCGMCVSACPYGHRHLVKEDKTSFPGEVAPYEAESSQRLNVVEKCTYCYERTLQDLLPACVFNCPAKCRIFGDVEDPASELSQYISKHTTINIEGTSTYYVIPDTMDKGLLPLAYTGGTTTAAAPQAEKESKSSDSNWVPAGVAIGVGAAALAVGVAASRKKSDQGGDER